MQPTNKTDKSQKAQLSFVAKNFRVLVYVSVAIIVISTLLIGLAYLLKKPKISAQKITEINIQLPNSTSTLSTKEISLRDSQNLGKDKQISLFVSQIGFNQNQSQNKHFLQYKQTANIQISYKDAKTKILVSFSSSSLEGQIYIPINSIIQFVINNQLSRRDTQYNDFAPQRLTFLLIKDLIKEFVKEELLKIGATNIRTSFEKYMDGKYNKDNKVFQLIGNDEIFSKDSDSQTDQHAAQLIDPINFADITGLSAENQIAAAVAKVIITIVQKIKQLINKNKKIIQEASGIVIECKNTCNQDTSTYLNQISDLIKGCTRLDRIRIRCIEDVWKSGLLPVESSTKYIEVPAIVIKMTL